MGQEIRLKYSGLVVFSSKILSIFTGLAFSIILTHSLSKPEFGAWTNIIGLLGTLGLLSGVFPFWAARYSARRFQGAMKLGFLANSLVAIPVSFIAVLVGPFLATAANTSVMFYLFAVVLLIQSYMIASLDSVVAVVKTHIIGYGYLSFEAIKLVLVYVLVAFLHLGIFAALFATFVGNVCWLVIYVFALSEYWTQKINYGYIVQWVKGSPLIFYGVGASLISGLDGYILLFRSGSLALAYYGAASLVVGPIAYTVSLSAALYPKLLAGGTSKDVEALFKMSLMFSVPLTVATVALSSSLLAVLNTDYVYASTVLIILALRGLTSTFGSMFDAVISGTEKLDATGNVSIRGTIKSRIFLSGTTYYLVYPFYLTILWQLLQPYARDPLGADRTTAFAGLITALLILSVKYLISRRALPVRFPLTATVKFLLVASILVAPALILPQPFNPIVTISLFLFGTGFYFLILYFIEDEARILINSVWKHLIGMF